MESWDEIFDIIAECTAKNVGTPGAGLVTRALRNRVRNQCCEARENDPGMSAMRSSTMGLLAASAIAGLVLSVACDLGAESPDPEEGTSGQSATLEVIPATPLDVVAREPERDFILYRAVVGKTVALRVFVREPDGARREVTKDAETLYEAISENLEVDGQGRVHFLSSGDILTRIGRVVVVHGELVGLLSFDILGREKAKL